jgi:hypothetical protein
VADVASAHSCSPPGWRESGARVERLEELSGCPELDLTDMPQGEQVLVSGDDDIGIRRQSGFDEAVVVGIPGDSDRLRWAYHDGGQREELDELVRVADDRLQLGVGEHAA